MQARCRAIVTPLSRLSRFSSALMAARLLCLLCIAGPALALRAATQTNGSPSVPSLVGPKLRGGRHCSAVGSGARSAHSTVASGRARDSISCASWPTISDLLCRL